jgi:glucuronate isomerase
MAPGRTTQQQQPDMQNGDLPDDRNLVGEMVKDICYNDARNYFGF